MQQRTFLATVKMLTVTTFHHAEHSIFFTLTDIVFSFVAIIWPCCHLYSPFHTLSMRHLCHAAPFRMPATASQCWAVHLTVFSSPFSSSSALLAHLQAAAAASMLSAEPQPAVMEAWGMIEVLKAKMISSFKSQTTCYSRLGFFF